MAKNLDQIVKRYLDATTSGAAKQKYIDGIDSTTVNPMELAADADQLFLARVEESVRSGRRAAKLRSTPVSRWKDGAKRKGAERLGSGAAAAIDKVRAHFSKWMPIYENISQTVAAMPKGTRQDAKDRSAKAIDMLMDAAGRS